MSSLGFSIVIPLYNKRDFVVEAVRSALDQLPLEVIVVDDGSTDGGADLVEAMSEPAIKLVRQRNAGVAAARNAGVAAATGTWVAFLDADDRFQPGHLAALRALAERFPEAGMLATGYCRLLPDGRREPVALQGGMQLLSDFFGQWSRLTFTCADAVAVKLEVLRAQRILFPVGERLGEDQDVWFRVAEVTPVAYSPVTLVDYRIDVAGSATATTPRPTDLLPCYVRLNERLKRGIVPAPLQRGARRLVASHWLNIARARHARGDRSDAWTLWGQSEARGHPLYWLRTGLTWLVGGH